MVERMCCIGAVKSAKAVVGVMIGLIPTLMLGVIATAGGADGAGLCGGAHAADAETAADAEAGVPCSCLIDNDDLLPTA